MIDPNKIEMIKIGEVKIKRSKNGMFEVTYPYVSHKKEDVVFSICDEQYEECEEYDKDDGDYENKIRINLCLSKTKKTFLHNEICIAYENEEEVVVAKYLDAKNSVSQVNLFEWQELEERFDKIEAENRTLKDQIKHLMDEKLSIENQLENMVMQLKDWKKEA